MLETMGEFYAIALLHPFRAIVSATKSMGLIVVDASWTKLALLVPHKLFVCFLF
jgi:hypothetical protein